MAEPRKKSSALHIERHGSVTEIRQVQNVALADATAKAGVSPWTGAMFKVSTKRADQLWPPSYHD